MKITVVTVCYNSEGTIKKTIESVLEQTYAEIEYIIIDGASTDSTLSFISEYKCDDRLIVISEPDEGLYDAMNKAADIATGEYIIYMNSGDVFADQQVLRDVSIYLDGHNDIVYGNTLRVKDKGVVLDKYYTAMAPKLLIIQGKMMCHQSMFIRSDIMRKYRYDTSFSITADYDFLVRAIHDKLKFRHADVTVCRIDNIFGISSDVSNMDIMRKQDDISLKTNFPLWYHALRIPKEMVRMIRRGYEKSR